MPKRTKRADLAQPLPAPSEIAADSLLTLRFLAAGIELLHNQVLRGERPSEEATVLLVEAFDDVCKSLRVDSMTGERET